MPVTMRDVAQQVGVSKQTVSAVLNGKPGISAATVARVRQAIAELGYQPNMVASSLRHGRTQAIGLLVGNVANPWNAELARGVEDVAQARGYGVMLCNTYDNETRMHNYLQMLMRNQIMGVIGGPIPATIDLPLVSRCISQSVPGTDDVRGGYVATAHLLDLGHRRIACITASTIDPGRLRLLGYRAAHEDWDVPVDESLLVPATLDYASGTRAIERLLEVRPLPSAVFVQQDLPAIGALAALKRAGLRVPEDIAVVGYDGLEIAALYDPALTTIVQPVYEMGVYAMTRLADRIEDLASQVDPQPLDCELVVRRSTVAGREHEWRSGPIASGSPWQGWRKDDHETEFSYR